VAVRILVVDDNGDIAGMLGRLLTSAGHHADVAANGARALERVAEREFDVILSDVTMPELDGIGLYRELAARHPRYLRRVIFMTGGQDPRVLAFLEEVAAPVLQKPFSLGDLAREIRAALAVSERERSGRPPR
jgi:CheY-like chemotaxis protein